jgi:hypothetical protein
MPEPKVSDFAISQIIDALNELIQVDVNHFGEHYRTLEAARAYIRAAEKEIAYFTSAHSTLRNTLNAITAIVGVGNLVALVAELRAVTQWQLIETVPKDGREVLLVVKSRAGVPNCMLVGHYMRGGHCIDDHPPIDAGWYFWNSCFFDKAAEPILWMPLPAKEMIATKMGLTAPQSPDTDGPRAFSRAIIAAGDTDAPEPTGGKE